MIKTGEKKFNIKRIVIPSLELDFDLFANDEDKEQFERFMNVMMSTFYEHGKNKVLRVYDFLGEMKAKK